ncbi:MAG: hypothetical protein NPINA01_31320 [Nitrospinaceae bacterium]|nr:MAG: hypothetical protein NPINA01_31320 [Nitrospinaceae bacterium]
MFIATRKQIFIILLSLALIPGLAFASEQSDRLPDLPNMIVEDDALETDNSPEPLYIFEDQSTLTMSEDTVITIDTRIYPSGKNSPETIITVLYGWVRLKGAKGMDNEGLFKIVTPSATAGGRETDFSAVVDSKGKTTFMVTEGQISTHPKLSKANNSQPFQVSSGEAQDFYPDGSHSTVRKLIRW